MMYHCLTHFYLVGFAREMSDTLKEIPALENFTHTFTESSQPDRSLAGQADVILADLRALDGAEAVRALLQAKGEQAQLILLAEQEQLSLLEGLPGRSFARRATDGPSGFISLSFRVDGRYKQ